MKPKKAKRKKQKANSYKKKQRRELRLLNKFKINTGPLKVKLWLENCRYHYYIINNGNKISNSTICVETMRYILSQYIFHIKIDYKCLKRLCTIENQMIEEQEYEEVGEDGTNETTIEKYRVINLHFKDFNCHYLEIYNRNKRASYVIWNNKWDKEHGIEFINKENIWTCYDFNLIGSAFNINIFSDMIISKTKNIQKLKIEFIDNNNIYETFDFIDTYNLWNAKEIIWDIKDIGVYAPHETPESIELLLSSFKTFKTNIGSYVHIDYSECKTTEEKVNKFQKYINKLKKKYQNQNINISIMCDQPTTYRTSRQFSRYIEIKRLLKRLSEICAEILTNELKMSKINIKYTCKLWNKIKIMPFDIRKQIY